MIFALIDYIQFRMRRGRYGDNQRDAGMMLAFAEVIPAAVVAKLQAGDAIFTQRFDSWKSWAMMFMTSSPIDHLAIYFGNDQIIHMTLDGSKKHSLRALTKGTRSLAVRFLPSEVGTPVDPPPGRGKLIPRERFSHFLPPKWQLAWVAVLIFHGFFPERFRWKFPIDLLFLAALIDVGLIAKFKFPVALPLICPSLLIMTANGVRFAIKKWLDHSFELLSHPDIAYQGFQRHGGLMFSKIGTLVIFPPIGILPIKAFLALARERPDDGTPDEFKQFSQGIRDVAEYLNIGPIPDHPEH